METFKAGLDLTRRKNMDNGLMGYLTPVKSRSVQTTLDPVTIRKRAPKAVTDARQE